MAALIYSSRKTRRTARTSIDKDSTYGVVYMGTPHQGGSGVQLGCILVNIASIFVPANDNILKHLERDSQWLQQQLSQYNPISGDFITKFAYETYETPTILGRKILVVPKASAVNLSQADAETIAIHADHINMIMANGAAEKIRSRWETGARVNGVRTRCHYIPLPKNHRFTGRTTVLEELRERLFIRRKCRKLALVGLGGVGKTQVALELAHWAKENQPDHSVFWVPVISDESFEQAYTELGRRLDVQINKNDDDPKESVRRHLESEGTGKWLLVVDNADDIKILDRHGGVGKYLPQNENGLILFTTRLRSVAVAAAGSDVVELLEMTPTEATSFFRKSLINESLLDDKGLRDELFEELTYLPLAIAQAAAFLNVTQLSVKKYLERLRRTEQSLINLMSQEFSDDGRYPESRNAVATTWLVSFDQIRRINSTAAELLCFLSCVERQDIPQSMLPEPPGEDVETAIDVLCEYAFLVRRGDDMFNMHRLVHIAIRVWVRNQNAVEETQSNAVRHLASIFPWDDEANRLLWREYLPHALYALRRSKEYEDEERSNLSYRCGTLLICGSTRRNTRLRCAYLDNRQIKEAIEIFEHVVAIRKKTLAEEDHDRLASEHELASAYLDNRQIKEAIEILEHIVAIEKKTLAEKDHDRLTSEHELASAYLDDGRLKEAIEIFEHVVAVRKTLAEEDHSRLTSEHELARAYLDNRQIKEAIEILEHIVAIEKKTLAEEDHDRLASEHELASAYLDNRQIKEAIEIFEHVVAIRKKTLAGEDHFRLTSEHGLASAYFNDGRIKEAIEIFERIVAIRKKTLAEEDHSRLTSEHGLASAYFDNGRIKEAIEIFKHVVAIRKKTLAEEDYSRLTSEHGLARAYLDDGRIKEAIEILEHVVAVKKTLAEEDRSRLASEHELARAYLDDARIKEAIEMLEHVVAVKMTLDMSSEDRAVSQDLLEQARGMLNLGSRRARRLIRWLTRRPHARRSHEG
ncbi:hypothetical protein RRF57_012839 [Xylaria bambusicola]|uniref:NB-ARC domain-containing protein n=1 Tax=Xylaria bambusicola TaxID=326684 RepID=A0AAN7ZB87_9PEZI